MVYKSFTWPVHAENLGRLDDELVALELQLEEIDSYGRERKGKCPSNNLPDSELAYVAFQAEIEGCIDSLSDLKIAHSIAHAVDTDGQAITDVLRDEAQAQQDRRLAMTMVGAISGNEAPPPYVREECTRLIACVPDEGSDLDRDSDECSAVCSCELPKTRLYFLQDVVAKASLCLLFQRSCQQRRQAFHDAEIEFSTIDRTYCSNVDCGKFLSPDQIKAGRAECDRCGSATCSMCKNQFHPDDCAADPLLQAALALATSKGWQRVTDHLRHNSGNHIHWTNTEQTGNLGRADHVIMRNPSCQGARESNDGLEVQDQRWIHEETGDMDLD
ncbi:IBR domain-containing protein [Microsporum canis CBS 113480]|uniref:IBR domain-containing protein n=1 Tax=Arthroderma otae (strain ATCC MYA-4605 / CBS 113480) TaxID=554155 RepID=C5FP44_ARTOC|nr:IBR domain-containing protein [Microsporum canis CBS 113480]EEQ31179.1 IBR domain-containing protein [Microsporum canis CBS 113480]